MLKPIALSFALVSLGYGGNGSAGPTIKEKIEKNFNLINYDYNKLTQKGSGINIGFIDSAFNVKHPSFAGKAIDTIGSNYLTPYKNKALQAMHGTHVAGIALGNYIAENLPYGIASQANLYSVSYLNPDYPKSIESSEEIIDFLNKNNVSIVNNSWGITYYPISGKMIDQEIQSTSFSSKYKDFPSDIKSVFEKANAGIGLKATMELAKAGILQIYSSGNEGQRSPNLNPSMRHYDTSLKAWINVGAVDSQYISGVAIKQQVLSSGKTLETDGLRGGFTTFSNSFKGAQAYSILAPGYEILSANAYYQSGLTPYKGYTNCTYDEQFCAFSGTSQAAPFVSGAAALVAEKYSFADGRLLADILLSTANSNVELPEIILKQSPEQWLDESGNKEYYYDIIYTKEVDKSKLTNRVLVKDDLTRILKLTDEQAEKVLKHLMHNDDASFATYMTKEELIGQGILDIEKALKGLAVLDANRMDNSDMQNRNGENQAIYVINTKGQDGVFENGISQKNWINDWHLSSLANVDKVQNSDLKIGLEKTGDGTLTLSGTNTYKGDTIASGGTLKLTGSLTESSVFAQNGGTFELSGGTIKKDATALNGGVFSITGSNNIVDGTLTSKNGGIILFNENSTLNAGGVVNNGGTLLFNKGSNLTATKGVDVQNSGLLKGQGTITGNLTNSGILKAGFYDEVTDTADKLGNLEVKGTFTQNTDGVLQIAFTNDNENSKFSATNYGDIKGSLVYVPLHTTASLIKANDEIQINLDSNNSNGSGSSHSLKDKLNDFTSVTAQSTNLLVFNIDNTDKTKLVAALKVTDGANADITKALQNVMSASHLSGDSKSVIVQLETLIHKDFNDALNSIKDSPSGSNVDTIDTLQKSLGLKNILFSLDPFSGVGGFNTASAIFAPTAAIGDQYLGKIDDIYIKTQTSGGMAYRNTNHNDYKQNMYMLDVQGKRKISDNALLGGFVGLATAKTTKHNSQINSNMFSLGVSYNHDLNVFGLLASASLGMSFNDSNNRILYTFGSDTNANYKHYFANFQVGAYKSFALTRDYRLIPIVMIDYSMIYQDSFKESGALAKSYDSNTIGYARGWLGTNFNHRLEFSNNWQLSTTLFAFYWMRFSDIRINQSLSFIEASDQKFTSSSSGEKQGLYAGIALEVKKANVFFRTSFSDEKTSAYNQFEVMLRGGINF